MLTKLRNRSWRSKFTFQDRVRDRPVEPPDKSVEWEENMINLTSCCTMVLNFDGVNKSLSKRRVSTMLTRLAVLFLLLSFLFTPVKGQATPLWPLRVGEEYVYHVWDTDGESDNETLSVVSQVTIGSDVFFKVTSSTDPGDSFIRSTSNGLYMWDRDGVYKEWVVGPTTPTVTMTVPYGGPFQAYALYYYYSSDNYDIHYLVPGIGFVGFTEYYKPTEYWYYGELVEKHTVPDVFSDVPSGYWAEDYIVAIYNAGITTGCAQDDPNTSENERRYCPEDSVTRGQMAAFIIRAKYGENFTYTQTPYFSDVPEAHTFFKYVQKLRDDGITVVSGTYGVDTYVTRGQMAAFIIRAKFGEDFSYTTTPYYSDVPSTLNFFKYVQKLKDEGITTVTGTYGVDDIVTRAQMAAFLARAFLGME